MREQKRIIILDTETNSKRKVFDVGIIVGDLYGNVIHRQAWILKEEFSKRLYFERRRGLYRRRLADRRYPIKIATIAEAFAEFTAIIEKYHVKEIYAYNAPFDFNHIDNLAIQYNVPNPLNGSRQECLWLWSCTSIFQQKGYPKFCLENGFVSAKGNIKTSAEVAYAYISKNAKFEEEHTALEDCEIEYAIFLHCRKQKKLRIHGVANMVWLMPQSKEQIQKLPKGMQTVRRKFDEKIENQRAKWQERRNGN